MNRAMVATEIFLLREAANLVHVYTCSEKLQLAREVSTVVAFPVWAKPIYYHGLLIGWASIESASDLERLLNNEKVPVFKLTEDDWTTSIKGSTKKSILTKDNQLTLEKKDASERNYISEMDLNEQGYDFYLRFLLNAGVLNQKKYVLRSLDIIMINSSIENGEISDLSKVEDYWTGHRLELNWSTGGVGYEASY